MAIDAVVVRFATSGVPEVTSAFAQVSKQAQKLEERVTRESEQGSRRRTGIARDEAREKEKAATKLAREQERLEKQKTKEAEREARRREGIVRKSSEMAGRLAEKLARDEAKEAERSRRAVVREEELKTRAREEASRAAAQASERAARAASRALAEESAARRRTASAFANYGKKWGGRIGSAASIVGATVGVGGAMMAADMAHQEMGFERTAALLVNAGTSGGVAPGTVQDVAAAAGATSKATGIDRGTLAAAALKYSQNARGGDFAGALTNMKFFADLSKVSGADIMDIAESAGTLQSQNKAFSGPGGMDRLQETMIGMLGQTHAGTISMTDLAKQIGVIGSTRSFFSQDQTKSQLQLSAIAQIARAGGDVGEAGTFTKDLAMEVANANKTFAKTHGHGLVSVDQHGLMTSPEQMVEDVLRGTHGNIQTIGSLFGRRGVPLFSELAKAYQEGEKTGGVEGGVKSAMAEYRSVAGATMSRGEFQKQLSVIDESTPQKFQTAMNSIEESMKTRLEPALEKLADKLSDPEVQQSIDNAISAISSLANFLLDLGPFKGVAAIIGARVAADLAQAGIGAAARAAIVQAIALVTGGGGGATAVGGTLGRALAKGAGPVAGAGGAMLGAAALVGGALGAGAGYALTNYSINAENADRFNAGSVKRKNITASDIARMQQEVQKRKDAVGNLQGGMSWTQTAMMGLFASNKEQQEFAANTLRDQKTQYEAAKKALAEMTEAFRAAKNAVPSGPPAVQPSSPRTPIGSQRRPAS